MSKTSALTVTYNDVINAADRLAGVAHTTPVFSSTTLNEELLAHVYVKAENLQRTGAFKFRGAYNALKKLRSQGTEEVLTYSSGNHAQAVALSARLLEMKAHIIMPEDAPKVKLDATAGYGANIITYDPEKSQRETLARELASEKKLPIIPPYDHPDIIAGQGTVAKELVEQVGTLDYLFVCCGGGGLLSGSAIAMNWLQPESKVIGVEPELADDATRTFRTGTLQTVRNPRTIADGARTPYLGEHTMPIVLSRVFDMVTVSESQIANAMRFFFERMKLVVEPTGALALAGALKYEGLSGGRIGVIISGGNVDLSRMAEYIELC